MIKCLVTHDLTTLLGIQLSSKIKFSICLFRFQKSPSFFNCPGHPEDCTSIFKQNSHKKVICFVLGCIDHTYFVFLAILTINTLAIKFLGRLVRFFSACCYMSTQNDAASLTLKTHKNHRKVKSQHLCIFPLSCVVIYSLDIK